MSSSAVEWPSVRLGSFAFCSSTLDRIRPTPLARIRSHPPVDTLTLNPCSFLSHHESRRCDQHCFGRARVRTAQMSTVARPKRASSRGRGSSRASPASCGSVRRSASLPDADDSPAPKRARPGEPLRCLACNAQSSAVAWSDYVPASGPDVQPIPCGESCAECWKLFHARATVGMSFEDWVSKLKTDREFRSQAEVDRAVLKDASKRTFTDETVADTLRSGFLVTQKYIMLKGSELAKVFKVSDELQIDMHFWWERNAGLVCCCRWARGEASGKQWCGNPARAVFLVTLKNT